MSGPDLNFSRGADAAKAKAKSVAFAKTNWFTLGDGEKIIVRFLTDAFPPDENDASQKHVEAWISVLQHGGVKTKPKPDGFEGNWPARMGAVCRYDEAFGGYYEDCYICDHLVPNKDLGLKRPSARVWSLGAIREVVIGDGTDALGGPERKGQPVGVRDKTREEVIPAREAKDGQEAREEKTVTVKDIVVINQGYKNFFAQLQGFAQEYGTVLDRDYTIRREGDDLATEYHIIPREPIQTADGALFDLRNAEHAAKYETSLNLADVVARQATDEYYARFFDPRFEIDKDGEVVKTGSSPEPVKSEGVEPDAARLAEVAARVKGKPVAQAEEETPAAASEPESSSEPEVQAAAASTPINFD